MHMVWHDHEIPHLIAIAVKVQQAVSNDLRKTLLSKHTFSPSLVQVVQESGGKCLVKFFSFQ